MAEKKGKTTKSVGGYSQLKAQKNQKISAADLMRASGASGTEFSYGIIKEEYLNELTGEKGMEVYNKMRRSDGQVAAVLHVCELPIKATQWYIQAAEDENGNVDKEQQEIAEYLEKCLFERMDITWNDLLNEILTMFQYGHSVFEKVYASDGEDIWLQSLSFRKQNSIKKWESYERFAGIIQQLPQPIEDPEHINAGLNEVFIPAAKLVVFTNKKEGDNYEGVSLLRPAYKHWYFKDKLYKFDGIRHERQSIGIPVMYIPSGSNDEDKKAAFEMVKNIRASEQSGVVVPGSKEDGWLFEFADLKASDNTNLFESIKHHNREIAKSVLAQFLELGDTDSGSRALGSTQQEMFLLSLEAACNNIKDIFNRFVIPEIIDFNFDVEIYPKLQYKKLTKADLDKIATALSSMISSGAITIDEELEQHLRGIFDLPKKSQEAIDKQEEDISGTKDKSKSPQGKDMKADGKEEDKIEMHEHGDGCSCLTQEYGEISKYINNDLILNLQKEYSSEQFEELKKKGFRLNFSEDQFGRELTFAERKVNLSLINKAFDKFQKQLEDKYDEVTKKQKEDLIRQVKKAIDDNNIKGLQKISTKYKGDLASFITDIQKEMFEVGKKTAAVEMNVKIPPTNKEIKGVMNIQNDIMVNDLSHQLENEAVSVASKKISDQGGKISTTNAVEILSALSEALDKKIKAGKNLVTSVGAVGAMNLGRTAIYQQYPEKIYAFQYSAILDSQTTAYCRALDGKVVDVGSKEFFDYQPPRHYNCRSIFVSILKEEAFKPEVTGIPSSIPKQQSLNTFKDMKKGGAAVNQQTIKDIVDKKIKQEVKKEVQQVSKQDEQLSKIDKNKYGVYKEIPKEAIKAFEDNFKTKLKISGMDDIVKKLMKVEMDIKNKTPLITEKEAIALRNYTQTSYDTNDLIRGKSVTSKTKEEKNVLLGRAFYVESALSKLPKYNGISARGMILEKDSFNKYIKPLKVGDIYQDKGFLSSSQGTEVMDNFKGNVEFQIKGISGVKVQGFSMWGRKEKEILFKPNTPFKITNITKKGKTTLIEMEEISSEQYSEIIDFASELGSLYDAFLEKIRTENYSSEKEQDV